MAKVFGLSDDDRETLRWNYNNLVNNLHVKIESVIFDAYSHQLIDNQDKTSLLAEIDPFSRTRKFLDIVPTRGPKALDSLLKIVEKVNKEVSDDIRNQMRNKQRLSKQASKPKIEANRTATVESDSAGKTHVQAAPSEETVDRESGGGKVSLYDDDDFDGAPIRRAPILTEKYIYKMESKPHGYAIIINNRKFAEMPERKGSDRDAEGMQNLLIKLGYRVAMGTDLSAAKMKDILQRWSEKDHTKCDSFVCVLLSHGEEGKIFGTDTSVDIEDLLGMFRGNRCSSLAGKPKIFFIQACRGTGFDEPIDVFDSSSTVESKRDSTVESTESEDEIDANTRQTLPSEADFLIGYSVVPGYYSWRNSTNGSWFMQAVIDIFNKYYNKLDLVTMLTLVNNEVATVESSTSDPRFNNKKQIPSCVNMLRKLVYFNNDAARCHGISG